MVCKVANSNKQMLTIISILKREIESYEIK
jgi:hypothetical protein